MRCWCQTLLCHLYGGLSVPYIIVPSVRCTVGAIHYYAIFTRHCWCHTPLCHTPSFEVDRLVSQNHSAVCRSVPLNSYLLQPTQTQNLTHFRTTYCCPQNDAQILYGGSFRVVYGKVVNGAANYFFSKITSSWFQDSSDPFLPYCPQHALPSTVRDGRSCSVLKCWAQKIAPASGIALDVKIVGSHNKESY